MKKVRVSRRAAAWFAIVMMGVAAVAVLVSVFNVQIRRIDSGSMTGTIPQGALILTYDTGDDMPLDRRDIILFRNPEDKHGGYTTHTYLGTTKQGTLITHGDANPSLDNFDPAPRRSDVAGKVLWHIDIFAPAFWQSWRGGLVCACVLLLTLASLLRSKDKENQVASQPA
jgi:signal peptidase I